MGGGKLAVIAPGTVGATLAQPIKVSKFKARYNAVYAKYRKKSRINRTVSQMNMNKAPFGSTKIAQLRYVDTVTLTTGTGTGFPGTHAYSFNNLVDVDVSGTGHSPLYYDQLGALYQNYKVFGLKFRLEFFNHDTNAQYDLAAMATPDLSYAPSNQLLKFTSEKRGVISKQYNFLKGSQVITGYIPAHTFMGVTKDTYAGEDDFGARFDYSSGPLKKGYLTICAADTSASSGSIKCKVILTFYVRCTMPKVALKSN